MERNESDLAYIAELHRALAAEAVTDIDFDRLRLWLEQLGTALPELLRAREESRLFRDDYLHRITGMLKAIAVARSGCKALGGSAELIERLPAAPAAELIENYRGVSARFRDTFPTSFGLIASRRAKAPKRGEMTDRV